MHEKNHCTGSEWKNSSLADDFGIVHETKHCKSLREKTTIPEYREGLSRFRSIEQPNMQDEGFPDNEPDHETLLVHMNFANCDNPCGAIDQVVQYLENQGVRIATSDHQPQQNYIDSDGGYFIMQVHKDDVLKCWKLAEYQGYLNRGVNPNAAPGADL